MEMTHFGKTLKVKLVSLRNDTRGATAIEYGLIAGLVSITLITALLAASGSLETMYSFIGDTLTKAAQ
jgi:pilus assembly protein Flp/PilA